MRYKIKTIDNEYTVTARTFSVSDSMVVFRGGPNFMEVAAFPAHSIISVIGID